jgi:hypothetical protein
VITVICGLASVLGGCTTAAVAAAGIAVGASVAESQATSFINGSLRAARFVTLEQSVAAAQHAMNDLHLDIRSERIDEHDAYIRGRAEPGPEVKVTMTFKSPMMTRIDVRVGFMGDQTVSRLVLSRIDAHLEHIQIHQSDLSDALEDET